MCVGGGGGVWGCGWGKQEPCANVIFGSSLIVPITETFKDAVKISISTLLQKRVLQGFFKSSLDNYGFLDAKKGSPWKTI